MSRIRSKFSQRQAGQATAVDVLALSPQARRYAVPLKLPAPVNGTLTYTSMSIPVSCKIVAAYMVYQVLPVISGGTMTMLLDTVAVNGSTTVNIVASLDVLSGFTAKVPVALTLAATNPTALTAGGSIQLTITSSANAPTADTGQGSLTLLLENIEDGVITDTDSTL